MAPEIVIGKMGRADLKCIITPLGYNSFIFPEADIDLEHAERVCM